jgi:hypothetical protein
MTPTTRTMTLLLAIALTGGCEWRAELDATFDPVANADGSTASPPFKYPERPPCKVCINKRRPPHQGGTP